MEEPAITNARAEIFGVPASEGVAIGPVYIHDPGELEPQRQSIDSGEAEAELQRFARAVQAVAAQLGHTRDSLESAGSADEARIFEAHIELACDPELESGVEEQVRESRSPESAVLAVGEEYAAMFAAMDDEYLAARADDVRDVVAQICAEITADLTGSRVASGLSALEEPSIILARSLAPSDTARIPAGMALGFVTAEGSRTSHVSIMARSLGVPAIVGAGESLLQQIESRPATVALDGGEGQAVADPGLEMLHDFEVRRERHREATAALEKYRHAEARTRSGHRVGVYANLGSASEAKAAADSGAEGVGLFRTEFLFMERDELPTEEEQYAAYRAVAEAFSGKPVIIRTLDVGGDKSLPGVRQPVEENPFLGWRGIRMSLDTPQLFRPQLRALLRAAADGEARLKVMFPMICRTEELRAAKEMVQDCRRELLAEGESVGDMETGAMIETPAAAVCARELAEEADFFSVGTNDLVQYTLAADRGNERLRDMPGAEHPAVLRLIGMAAEAANEAGIEIGVCGEAAGEPEMIPLLVEAGVHELSMSPPSIAAAKKIISRLE